jgi:hypothetical protein
MRKAITHNTQLFMLFQTSSSLKISSELTRAPIIGKMALKKKTHNQNLQT